MLNLAPPSNLDHELVFRFFWLFSMFECAMKRSGFVKPDRHGNAQPDWTKFLAEADQQLALGQSKAFDTACTFLNSKPPQQQVVENDQLSWRRQKRVEGESDVLFALRMARTVRNNLFHGGKYSQVVQEVGRDNQLLEAVLCVLTRCFEVRSDFRDALAYAA